MVYILTDQLEKDDEAERALARYHAYLRSVEGRFPRGAFELASSTWYHDFADHRCPHDAWLEELRVAEFASGERQEQRRVDITVRLFGAYHDGHILLRYHDVVAYRCDFVRPAAATQTGHSDWRYDEFRLSEQGSVVHEIEWWHACETARWVIEARDVTFTWLPISNSPDAA